MANAVWRGKPYLWDRLVYIVSRYCDCSDGNPPCLVHAMLTDQNVLNHLEFVYRNREIYMAAEFGNLPTSF